MPLVPGRAVVGRSRGSLEKEEQIGEGGWSKGLSVFQEDSQARKSWHLQPPFLQF